jgi:Spindle and kinetochore-associated protein 1
MSKAEREMFWQHKEASGPETKGKTFVCESDLREHKWSKSKFTFNAVGRNVITILRHLGRVREKLTTVYSKS